MVRFFSMEGGTVATMPAAPSSQRNWCRFAGRQYYPLRSARLLTRAVQGLCDALLAMQEGARWEVVVPPQLGYGGSKHGALRVHFCDTLCLAAAFVSRVHPQSIFQRAKTA